MLAVEDWLVKPAGHIIVNCELAGRSSMVSNVVEEVWRVASELMSQEWGEKVHATGVFRYAGAGTDSGISAIVP